MHRRHVEDMIQRLRLQQGVQPDRVPQVELPIDEIGSADVPACVSPSDAHDLMPSSQERLGQIAAVLAVDSED
jgi:hypothetical protein